MESLIGVAPFKIGTAPAVASIAAASAVFALCAWAFPVVSAQPAAERPVFITILDRDPTPVPDTSPRASATSASPGEPRPAASRAEIPPPPAAVIATIEDSTLVMPFAQGAPRPVLRPEWGDLPVTAEQPTTFQPVASSGIGGDTLAFWQSVRLLVAARAVYPPAAARRRSAGQVVIRVRVRPEGTLDGATVASASGDPALDRAAVAAVREAAPFPIQALGAAAGTNILEALIPLRFEFADRHGDNTTKTRKEEQSQ